MHGKSTHDAECGRLLIETDKKRKNSESVTPDARESGSVGSVFPFVDTKTAICEIGLLEQKCPGRHSSRKVDNFDASCGWRFSQRKWPTQFHMLEKRVKAAKLTHKPI